MGYGGGPGVMVMSFMYATYLLSAFRFFGFSGGFFSFFVLVFCFCFCFCFYFFIIIVLLLFLPIFFWSPVSVLQSVTSL